MLSSNAKQFKHELDIGGPNKVMFIEGVSFDKNRNTQLQRSLTMREKRKKARSASISTLATYTQAVSWTTPCFNFVFQNTMTPKKSRN